MRIYFFFNYLDRGSYFNILFYRFIVDLFLVTRNFSVYCDSIRPLTSPFSRWGGGFVILLNFAIVYVYVVVHL